MNQYNETEMKYQDDEAETKYQVSFDHRQYIEGKTSQFLSVSLTQVMGCFVKIFDLFQLVFPHIIIQKKRKQKGKKTHSNTH